MQNRLNTDTRVRILPYLQRRGSGNFPDRTTSPRPLPTPPPCTRGPAGARVCPRVTRGRALHGGRAVHQTPALQNFGPLGDISSRCGAPLGIRRGHAEIPGGFRGAGQGEAGDRALSKPLCGETAPGAAGERGRAPLLPLCGTPGGAGSFRGPPPLENNPPGGPEKRLQQPAALARREKAEDESVRGCAALPANPKRPPLRGSRNTNATAGRSQITVVLNKRWCWKTGAGLPAAAFALQCEENGEVQVRG